jgi:8-oxo-dGTP diphosphatase
MSLAHVDRLKNTRHVMVALPEAPIKVSVAIITDREGRILITQRAAHISHGGFWEFPGGKVELYESPEMALLREVKEEVGLNVVSYRYLGEVHHQYDEYQVILYGYHVQNHFGEASCCESQTGLCWTPLNDLEKYNFPLANKELIRCYTALKTNQNII